MERYKDYILYTKYENNIPIGIYIYYQGELEDRFQDRGLYEYDCFNSFLNDVYKFHEEELDEVINKIENKKINEIRLYNYDLSSINDNDLFILNNDGYTIISFDEFYKIKNEWKEEIKKLPNNIYTLDSIETRIDTFIHNYDEFHNDFDSHIPDYDNHTDLRNNSIRSVFLPVLYEKDNKLQLYIMVMFLIYFNSPDCEIDLVYYDYDNDKMYKSPYNKYVYDPNYTICPYIKTKLTNKQISILYRMVETLIREYHTNKDNYYYFLNEYKELLSEWVMTKYYVDKYMFGDNINSIQPYSTQLYSNRDNGKYKKYYKEYNGEMQYE